MTRFPALLLSFTMLLATAWPAAAQPIDRSYGWNGYGHMWEGWMFPGMGIVVAFLCLLALIGLAGLFLWATRGLFERHGRGGPGRHGGWALDILAERFARGEIDQAEFESKRRLIGR